MLRAIGNRVILKVEPPELVTKSGIILTALPETNWNQAEVVSVGPKVKEKDIKPGGIVKVRGEQGLDYEWEDVQYLIVSEYEILAEVE